MGCHCCGGSCKMGDRDCEVCNGTGTCACPTSLARS